MTTSGMMCTLALELWCSTKELAFTTVALTASTVNPFSTPFFISPPWAGASRDGRWALHGMVCRRIKATMGVRASERTDQGSTQFFYATNILDMHPSSLIEIVELMSLRINITLRRRACSFSPLLSLLLRRKQLASERRHLVVDG